MLRECGVENSSLIVEITNAGDVHYHGIVSSEQDLRGLQYTLACTTKQSAVFGFFTVKELKDEAGWVEYISKDLETTHKLISRPSVLCDDLQIFKHITDTWKPMPL